MLLEKISVLNPDLKAQALHALQNPPAQSAERDDHVFAFMTAESLKLEGIETNTEEILELVRAQRKPPIAP